MVTPAQCTKFIKVLLYGSLIYGHLSRWLWCVRTLGKKQRLSNFSNSSIKLTYSLSESQSSLLGTLPFMNAWISKCLGGCLSRCPPKWLRSHEDKEQDIQEDTNSENPVIHEQQSTILCTQLGSKKTYFYHNSLKKHGSPHFVHGVSMKITWVRNSKSRRFKPAKLCCIDISVSHNFTRKHLYASNDTTC